MQVISCDVCKKKMDDPITNRNFFYYARHSLCESCRDGLELQIRSTIRSKEPYAMDWYQKYVDDSINKAIQKGKI